MKMMNELRRRTGAQKSIELRSIIHLIHIRLSLVSVRSTLAASPARSQIAELEGGTQGRVEASLLPLCMRDSMNGLETFLNEGQR